MSCAVLLATISHQDETILPLRRHNHLRQVSGDSFLPAVFSFFFSGLFHPIDNIPALTPRTKWRLT